MIEEEKEKHFKMDLLRGPSPQHEIELEEEKLHNLAGDKSVSELLEEEKTTKPSTSTFVPELDQTLVNYITKTLSSGQKGTMLSTPQNEKTKAEIQQILDNLEQQGYEEYAYALQDDIFKKFKTMSEDRI